MHSMAGFDENSATPGKTVDDILNFRAKVKKEIFEIEDSDDSVDFEDIPDELAGQQQQHRSVSVTSARDNVARPPPTPQSNESMQLNATQSPIEMADRNAANMFAEKLLARMPIKQEMRGSE